jgi:hypothetical protein
MSSNHGVESRHASGVRSSAKAGPTYLRCDCPQSCANRVMSVRDPVHLHVCPLSDDVAGVPFQTLIDASRLRSSPPTRNHSMLRYAAYLLALPATLASATIHAAPRAEPTTVHAHDGFFLRLSLGMGYENFHLNSGRGDLFNIGGFGYGSSLAIGGCVVPNLALHADFFGSGVFDPHFEQNGVDLGELTDGQTTQNAVGFGATYYFMPLNLYVGLSLGVGFVRIDHPDLTIEPDPGFAMNAMVGKEFWVGNDWGIGVAAQFIYNHIPTENSQANSEWTSFNILFSATYN